MNKYSYDNLEIRKLIEKIALTTSNKYRQIAYYDTEDLAQEVRIKCIQALKHYDPNRSDASLETFLVTCADNRIRDIRRFVLFKHNNPCKSCEFYDIKNKKRCIKYSNKSLCSKYAKHEKSLALKIASNSPSQLDPNRLMDNHISDEVFQIELLDYIHTCLCPEYYEDFMKVYSANFNFNVIRSEDRRAELISVLSMIMQDFYEE
ncbi:hypothetical protein KKE60_06290 [Patescibacteria group bacterium]|nr:hypothetical protein [Patescibacteria group bacterium]